MYPNHEIDETTGALRQVRIEQLKVYDQEYVRSRYDVIDCQPMSRLRFELLVGHCDLPKGFRLLDFGCGNGAFLREAKASTVFQPRVFGYDVSGYPLADIEMIPGTVNSGNRVNGEEKRHRGLQETFDVVTFFDSLEHVKDPNEVLGQVQAKYVMISVPWCHMAVMGWKWFARWKHRRPDEHLWYFDAASLCNLLRRHQFKPLFLGNPEDKLRQPADHLPNIMTGIFVKDNATRGALNGKQNLGSSLVNRT